MDYKDCGRCGGIDTRDKETGLCSKCGIKGGEPLLTPEMHDKLVMAKVAELEARNKKAPEEKA